MALFAWNATLFYLPGQGFTYLIQFGTMENHRYLPELRAVNHYEMPNSPGYDSQWYAQIAMRPHLGDPTLKKAVDWLPYRARRILFPLVASWLALGNPVRAMHIYAAENIACWFLLAGLLLRWFPPRNWGNCARWAAVLFSFGLIFSVDRALLDGPSLLLVATAMALVESRRPWMGAVLLGISGLGKDTNVLCGAGMTLPAKRDPRSWIAYLARAALVILPLVAWTGWLRLWFGRGDDLGPRNFALPFSSLANKLQDSVSLVIAGGYPARIAKFDLLVMAGLLAQFLFFLFRLRSWRDPWWRVGAAYAVLMMFLGDAVWENYPSAAARVLLPMTLAFNILVPRGRWWPLLLLVGNLGVISSIDISKPPGRESYRVRGPSALQINPRNSAVVEAIYGPRNWWTPEKSRWWGGFFRWSLGEGTITLRNPQPFSIMVKLNFGLRAADGREAIVAEGPKVLWQGALKASEVREVNLGEMELPPGDTVLTFRSDRPAAYPGNGDLRRLNYAVKNFEIDLLRRR